LTRIANSDKYIDIDVDSIMFHLYPYKNADISLSDKFKNVVTRHRKRKDIIKRIDQITDILYIFTSEDIKDFQKRNKIKTDGVIGYKTYIALNSCIDILKSQFAN
jgi:murein L,D-transpeptidase YcbB/YkuD